MNKSKLSNKLGKKTTCLKSIIRKLTNVNFIYAILILTIIFAIVLSPKKYSEFTFQGIRVWATCVLPSLFPFMIFSKLLTATGFPTEISKHFSKPTKKLFNCPEVSSYVFLMSILAGYPLGAKLTSELYENGKISRTEAHRICSFTSNSGPMFIVGTVGVGMLLSQKAAVLIYISHILGALVNGLLFRSYTPKEIPQSSQKIEKKNEFDLSKTMLDGVNSILLVGGFITIFFVVTEVFSSLGFFKPISLLLSTLGLEANVSNGLIFGFFEMTKGCLLVASSTIPLAFKASICCFLISFGGLAISFQALAFLNKFKISKKFFFMQKTTQGIISFLICLALCSLFL